MSGEQRWPRDYWHMVSWCVTHWSLPTSQCLLRTGAGCRHWNISTSVSSDIVWLHCLSLVWGRHVIGWCRTLEYDPQQEMIGAVISCQKMIASLSIIGHFHQKQIIKRIKLEHLQNWDELPVVRNQNHSEIVQKHWNAPTASSHLCCKKEWEQVGDNFLNHCTGH